MFRTIFFYKNYSSITFSFTCCRFGSRRRRQRTSSPQRTDVFVRSSVFYERTSGLQAAACVNSSTRSRKAGSCSIQVSMAGGRRHGNTCRIHLPHGKLIIIRCAGARLVSSRIWKFLPGCELSFPSPNAAGACSFRNIGHKTRTDHGFEHEMSVRASKNQGFTTVAIKNMQNNHYFFFFYFIGATIYD